MAKDDEAYEIDEDDGLRRAKVGQWTLDKHARLLAYVGASSGARSPSKGWPRTTYIDLYCGPGRSRIRETDQVIDGSPLVAVKEAAKRQPFTEIHIADKDPENVAACKTRLEEAGFKNVHEYVGEAVETAGRIADKIGLGLHLAFLDPYNLLEFAILRQLAKLKHIDLLMHVSEQDLQREAIGKQSIKKLDAFAPGCSDTVDLAQRNDVTKMLVFNYWKTLLMHELGMNMREKAERVRGGNNQPLYWLVLASRATIAGTLWNKVADPTKQPELF